MASNKISGPFSLSDRTLKENITVIPNALDKINAISGNTFTWKGGFPDGSVTGRGWEFGDAPSDTGLIAQEVEALGLPGITSTTSDGTKVVSYKRLIPVLVQAIKELTVKVNALENG